MRNWCKGKTEKQIEDELWRQIDTYNEHDLREFFFNALSAKEKRNWVNSWHDNDMD
jgi:hypothetical protein